MWTITYLAIELDDEMGDVLSDIKDRQKALLLSLEENILDVEEPLQLLATSLGIYEPITMIKELFNIHALQLL